jgi:hypothetical protein
MKHFSKKFKSKPSYGFYIELWETLNTYLMLRIDNYIFFKYNNWVVPSIHPNDMDILKTIMEYDYKVFKVLLFLYWDLEYYLQDKNKVYVKKSLLVDTIDLVFLKIKMKNYINSFDLYYLYMLSKKTKSLWAYIEKRGLFNLLLKYDLYTKIYSLNTKYKNDPDIEILKLYKKFNDIISYQDIMLLREDIGEKEKIDPSYYQGYIDE